VFIVFARRPATSRGPARGPDRHPDPDHLRPRDHQRVQQPVTASFDPTIAGIILFSAMLLVHGAGHLRRPGAAIAIAAVLGSCRRSCVVLPWQLTPTPPPWLPLRDGLTPKPPELPGAIPMFLIVALSSSRSCSGSPADRETQRRHRLPAAWWRGGARGRGHPSAAGRVLTDPTGDFGQTTIALLAILGIALGGLAASSAAGSPPCCAPSRRALWRSDDPPEARRPPTTRLRRLVS